MLRTNALPNISRAGRDRCGVAARECAQTIRAGHPFIGDLGQGSYQLGIVLSDLRMPAPTAAGAGIRSVDGPIKGEAIAPLVPRISSRPTAKSTVGTRSSGGGEHKSV